ncbi:MAG: beta-galactosidase [Chlamydiota bacterium]|nr:beta-galactosidase [Chlamydiota bacterium]
MPQNVGFKDGRFLLNGKDFYIYSGEVHYFRIDPKHWDDRLKKAKSLGFNTIATYSPWGWHEIEEGKFDFTGKTHPRRDFVGFVKAVKKAGLYLIARVGPVSNGEMVGEGLPSWLLEDYPEVRAKNFDGTIFEHGKLVSFHHPKFREFVQSWYKKILPIVKKNQFTKGGNIILVQLCNEIGMINWIAAQPDYDESATKVYHTFLEKKYGDVQNLNEAYDSSFPHFQDVHQPDKHDHSILFQRAVDWNRAYQDYFASYFAWLAKEAKSGGIDVPIQANIPHFYDYDTRGRGHYSPMTTMLFKNYTEQTGPVIFGGAYQIRRLDYDNCQDIPFTTEMVRMISDKEVPLVCAEMQTGIMRDYPRLYPTDVELNLKTSMGQGLNGMNCYMLCGGTNPKGLGHFGTYHEWQAPIDSKGNFKAHAVPLAQFGELVSFWGHLISDTKKAVDFTIGFYPPYYETCYVNGEIFQKTFSDRNKLFYDGLVRLVHIAGYNYDCINIESATLEELLKVPALLVYSMDFMAINIQEKLAQYVQKGGVLVLNPYTPYRDLRLHDSNVFLTSLGLELGDVLNERFMMMDGIDSTVHCTIHPFKKGYSSVFAKTQSGKPCGIVKKSGKGKAIILNAGLTHEFDYHIQLMISLLERAGVKKSIFLSNPDLLGTLRVGEKGAFLFLYNYHEVDEETDVVVRLGQNKLVELPKGQYIPARSAMVLPVQFRIDDTLLIEYTTWEILGFGRTNKGYGFNLYGFGPCNLKFKCQRPHDVVLDGQPVSFQYASGYLSLSTEIPEEEAVLEINFKK